MNWKREKRFKIKMKIGAWNGISTNILNFSNSNKTYSLFESRVVNRMKRDSVPLRRRKRACLLFISRKYARSRSMRLTVIRKFAGPICMCFVLFIDMQFLKLDFWNEWRYSKSFLTLRWFYSICHFNNTYKRFIQLIKL